MMTIPLNTDSSPDAVIELLFKLKVKDVMTSDILTVSPQTTMRDIQRLMREHYITGIPIVENRQLAGIVSMDDIVNALDGGWIEEPAEQHMTRNVIVLQESMPVSFCVSCFNKYNFGRFPVLNKENELIGIVTSSDVISALLVAMNKEVERLEQKAHQIEAAPQPEVQSEPLGKQLAFETESFNFEIAGRASTELKKVLKSMGINPAVVRRIGIASYELEINQVVHSEGGVMRYTLSPDMLVIEAADRGPGIPDLEKALQEGFSTATDRVRALGFGAGMGLPNTRRVSDAFDIQSEQGKGTTVRVSFSLGEQAV
ncbi:MAG: CBS domain-containing protein [Spirochaetaceae bacterium]|jgi:CBS domain-containing protein/anti-sigma regulatory factor (Ser/Thr protein kinase)|nr:CBS domain-containing protein [Spirochaetaceae bacterium]